MGILGEISKKADPTKITVLEGDIPAGQWLFNGHAMILVDRKGCDQTKSSECESTEEVTNKICIPLANNVRIDVTSGGESTLVGDAVSQMTPLYGTIFGMQLANAVGGLGPFGALAGFAAGSMVGRNDTRFYCVLNDGRRFFCQADLRIFKRIQQLARTDKDG